MLQLDPVWLKKQGLEIPPSKLWDPKTGSGLLAATIATEGCSAAFVSPDGLFVTNHHCLFAVLQEHATPQDDIITNGFLARKRSEELNGSVRVTVPRSFTDVTKQIEAAIPSGASDVERTRAIQHASDRLVAECEKRPATRCKVAAFDGGVQYMLVDAIELQDVRLVYAPPRAIGEYGGEVDNWMWPRHTGDFAIGRAYVAPDGSSAKFSANNVPYKPKFHIPVSTSGVKPGDFVMVLGYPGVTYRSLTAEEMSERRDFYFTQRVDIYGEWIRLMEQTTKGNAAGEIAVASDLKSLSNRFKNAEGQIAGFRRGKILETQKTADEKVLAWAAKNAAHSAAADAYRGLAAMAGEQKKSSIHDFLLREIQPTATSPSPLGPKALVFGANVAASAIERAKPEAERDALFSARNFTRQRDRLAREQKNLYQPKDDALLASWVKHALALPADQRIEPIDRLFAGATDDGSIARRIAELDQQSKIFDEAQRLAMFEESLDQLRARRDPYVDLALALQPELRAFTERKERWEGTLTRLRPVWRRAVIAHAGKPVAPDANSTLRVTFAHVAGYTPRDAVRYEPQTTLSGVVEKHTGEEPFDAPERELVAVREKRFGKWKDARLGDVPVNFLADADTTGGNSGSPTVNGRGELVGLNFDRVWENVANDFGYNQDVARNVNVDIRYMLWLLDQVEHADELLKELKVR